MRMVWRRLPPPRFPLQVLRSDAEMERRESDGEQVKAQEESILRRPGGARFLAAVRGEATWLDAPPPLRPPAPAPDRAQRLTVIAGGGSNQRIGASPSTSPDASRHRRGSSGGGGSHRSTGGGSHRGSPDASSRPRRGSFSAGGSFSGGLPGSSASPSPKSRRGTASANSPVPFAMPLSDAK